MDYAKNRKYIYEFYKDKNNIEIDMFQSVENMSHIKKIENNTDRMLNNFKNNKEYN